MTTLISKAQGPGQSIDDFYPKYMPFGIIIFTAYQHHQRVIIFIMTLHDRFESIWASLLHRSLVPSLDNVILLLRSFSMKKRDLEHNRICPTYYTIKLPIVGDLKNFLIFWYFYFIILTTTRLKERQESTNDCIYKIRKHFFLYFSN